MDETSEERPLGEKQVLAHEPVPGYRTALHATIAAGILWLLLAFTGAL